MAAAQAKAAVVAQAKRGVRERAGAAPVIEGEPQLRVSKHGG